MRVVMAASYGFCAGVRHALQVAEEALRLSSERGIPCYVYGDIVHSSAVMDDFLARGMVRISSSEEAEAPGLVVIRAHGIPDSERNAFIKRGLEIADATCPVVLRSQRLVRESGNVLVIGKAGHSEVVSLLGSGRGGARLIEEPDDLLPIDRALSYSAVVQTTFSLPVLSAIRKRADELGISLSFMNTICAASTERRTALDELSSSVSAIVVAGDAASRNTVELWEEGKRTGRPSFLVPSPSAIPSEVFTFPSIGLTAGASCPDTLIYAIRRRLEDGR